MDHNSIIDRNTFTVYEHAEDYPEAFICDKPIAKAVALLNKKGYKTVASCSGHYYVNYSTDKAHTYILFDKVYEFKNLPDGFNEEVSKNTLGIDRTSIDYEFSRYKKENNTSVLKSEYEFITEVENISQKLTNWVENLPEYRERND